MPPESSAPVAVAFAAIGLTPNATSTGYATSMPPPASAFTAPAAAAAARSITTSDACISVRRPLFHGTACAQRDVEGVHRGGRGHRRKLSTATVRTRVGYYWAIPTFGDIL